jgi:hypothetical protein
MRKLFGLGIASIAAFVACGGSNPKPPTFVQPAGTVAVNFSVDDTANKAYASTSGGAGPSDLQWKGAMIYDPATNKVTADATWGGPWAALYDDGPWTAGGHEPAGATAGDHIFGVTVFVVPPTTGTGDTYSYGLNDNLYQTKFGNGWIWPAGPNGAFTVAPGATTPIKADGLTLKKFGTTDLQLTIDKTALLTGTAWDTSKVTLKGSGWAWGEVTLTATANTYVYTLSSVVGAGNQFPHTGLFNSGDKPEFIYVFNGKEYKDASGLAATAGITAGVKASGASAFTTVAVQVHSESGGNKNTYVTIP